MASLLHRQWYRSCIANGIALVTPTRNYFSCKFLLFEFIIYISCLTWYFYFYSSVIWICHCIFSWTYHLSSYFHFQGFNLKSKDIMALCYFSYFIKGFIIILEDFIEDVVLEGFVLKP